MLGNTNAKIVIGGSQQQGEYFVKVIDYDGTVIDEQWLDDGAEYTLPSAPSHEGLVFQEWSSSETITNGKITIDKNNVMIGATYTTVSGQNEFDIELTSSTGLNVTLNMSGTKDWGDGTIDTNSSHSYTQEGKYTIKCDGAMSSSLSASNGLFGQSGSSVNRYVKFARLVVATITSNSLRNCKSLQFVTISNNCSTIGFVSFRYDENLFSVTIPNSITLIDESVFEGCYYLRYVVLPNTISLLKNACFQDCRYSLNIVIPSSVTEIKYNSFSGCYYSPFNLNIYLNELKIGQTAMSSFYHLHKVKINKITELVTGAFSGCNMLKEIEILSGLVDIPAQTFSNCYSLSKVGNLKDVASIGNGAFYNCYNVLEYDFSEATSIPTLNSTDVFYGINPLCKIKVPTALYDEWIATNNWSTYANYIVAV